jgi:inward rectifier potassium channel
MSNGPTSARSSASGASGAPRQNLGKRSNDARLSLPKIRAVGQKLAPHEDFYHWVLSIGWLAFFGWASVAYLVTNAVFGLAFYLAPGSVSSAQGYSDCFFFSVQTFATIGYGVMAPQSFVGHLLVTVEALAGIFATAIITGITFARLARPSARVLFSEKAVVNNRDGVPHLQFRMANWRRNQIAEAQLHAMILMKEVTAEGETMRRPVPIKLVRDRNPMFLLSWTAMHRIDEHSPFYGEGAIEKLRGMEADIFLTLTGLDETISQTINTRYRYVLDDIVWHARFTDIVSMEDGVRIIDFDKFHGIEMIDEAKPK